MNDTPKNYDLNATVTIRTIDPDDGGEYVTTRQATSLEQAIGLAIEGHIEGHDTSSVLAAICAVMGFVTTNGTEPEEWKWLHLASEWYDERRKAVTT